MLSYLQRNENQIFIRLSSWCFRKASRKSILDILLFVSAPSCWKPWVQARRLKALLGVGNRLCLLVSGPLTYKIGKLTERMFQNRQDPCWSSVSDHLPAVCWADFSGIFLTSLALQSLIIFLLKASPVAGLHTAQRSSPLLATCSTGPKGGKWPEQVNQGKVG